MTTLDDLKQALLGFISLQLMMIVILSVMSNTLQIWNILLMFLFIVMYIKFLDIYLYFRTLSNTYFLIFPSMYNESHNGYEMDIMLLDIFGQRYLDKLTRNREVVHLATL